MRTRERQKVLARGFFRSLAAAAVFAGLVYAPDWEGLLESFWSFRVEEKALAVWSGQTKDVSCRQCRADPVLCLDKFVRWRIQHMPNGSWCADSDGDEQLLWMNEAQLPVSGSRSASFEAVARVKAVRPDRIELLYIGSPQAAYSGTTWRRKF
ncbi:MAG: hypothetical protein A2X36_00455 [Elusimicrobia bacterium GWA2_69_24]|nr:MAG: hypothetical protein A2X36_00455 [Elusimicrobia bacterium GWA2_69_24]HBL16290.1 hypothetical protein [Elusimicrobiota bacterium]